MITLFKKLSRTVPYILGSAVILIGILMLHLATNSNNKALYIEKISGNEALESINAGKRIIFVDVREPDEFIEERIKGAINIPMRDINAEVLASLSDADIVIPYCVKDFRGFEVAKVFKQQGLRNVRVLEVSGIAGWNKLSLPVESGEQKNNFSAEKIHISSLLAGVKR